MLQHSRSSSGVKEPTDINALCDEYLRLSYHGLRAKDKSFNAKFEVDFDSSIPKLNVVPQDIGRVVLNLINNAFYVVNERSKLQAAGLPAGQAGYQPQVTVSTKNLEEKLKFELKTTATVFQIPSKKKSFNPSSPPNQRDKELD
jgi:two-component system NtrC family sensor kinase